MKLVVFAVFLCSFFSYFTLRGLENRVTEALEGQRKINRDIESSLRRANIPIPLLDSKAKLALSGDALSLDGKPVATKAVTIARPPEKVGGVVPGGARSGGAAAAGGSPLSVVIEPPMVHDLGSSRDRDGRLVIDKEDKHDTDSTSSGDSSAAAAAAEEEVRLTAAPPPPRPVLPTVAPGKKWPADDANFGFESDSSLPTFGVITLNAQANAGGGIGLAQKSSWMHRMSYTNKQAYCKKWGYDLIIEDNSIIDTTRDVAWSKIPIFKKWLPKYQWLLWIDMDAFFMRFDKPMIELADNDKDLIIAKDWHGINFGVFLIRNSPWSFALLDKMWRSPQEWWKPWEEQSALMALIDPKKNPGEALELLEHIHFPRQRDLNSYGAEFAYGNLQALYRTGDPIVHFPNCKGFQTCRSTIESFYRTMLQDTGVEELDAAEIPAAQFPEGSV